MNKKIIFLILLIGVLALLFIPVTRQKKVLINASFLNVYSSLLKPEKWERWRPDIRKIAERDSAAVIVKKDTNFFSLRYADRQVNVNFAGSIFDINDEWGGKQTDYSFVAVPGKTLNTSEVTVTRKTSLIGCIFDQFRGDPFAETHVAELKNFMEVDSLRYGCTIFKTKVPEEDLLEIKHTVPVKDRFREAAKMFSKLQNFIDTQHAKQMQPVIAQFLMKGRDSADVNVGLFVDRKIKSSGDIIYTRMPKGGPLYAAHYTGKFDQRQKIYEGLHQYFTDHLYQTAVLPFETYLDNKLPTADTDKIRIQVNFTTFF